MRSGSVHEWCVSVLIAAMGSLTVHADEADRTSSKPVGLLRLQYQITDPSFCHAATCVDYDGDGTREILFASRETRALQMLSAADGSLVWSKKLDGKQQSLSAFDLDGDGGFEIVYSVSSPGSLYVLDWKGNVLRSWNSGDKKLGNSAVIFDADGDGNLDGFFGSRT